MGDLTDEQAEAICIMIKNGYGKAFPMDENGHQVGWYDWLRSHINSPDNDRLKALNAELAGALKGVIEDERFLNQVVPGHFMEELESARDLIRKAESEAS